MNYMNRTVALVSGILLYAAIECVPAVKYVAATTPTWFLLSLAWFWMVLRWVARPARVAVWWCLGGLVVGFICSESLATVQSYYQCAEFIEVSALPLTWFYGNLSDPRGCSVLNSLLNDLFYLWRFETPAILICALGAAALMVRVGAFGAQWAQLPQKPAVFKPVYVAAAALFSGAISVALWVRAEVPRKVTPPGASFELVSVAASGVTRFPGEGRPPEHYPPRQWTSTKLTVKKGDMVLVMPGGIVSINLLNNPGMQMVTPAGAQNGMGLLEMQFGDGDVIPVGRHGLGKWVSGFLDHAPESGPIKFRIRGTEDRQYELVGRYRVQVVVLPPFSP
jgi:hypothetical protein